MSYKKHHSELHTSLKEFERLTGTGNVKTANLMMAKVVRSLVGMVESQQALINTPKTGCGGACGGNCECGTKPVPVVTAAEEGHVIVAEDWQLDEEQKRVVDAADDLLITSAIQELPTEHDTVPELLGEPNPTPEIPVVLDEPLFVSDTEERQEERQEETPAVSIEVPVETPISVEADLDTPSDNAPKARKTPKKTA